MKQLLYISLFLLLLLQGISARRHRDYVKRHNQATRVEHEVSNRNSEREDGYTRDVRLLNRAKRDLSNPKYTQGHQRVQHYHEHHHFNDDHEGHHESHQRHSQDNTEHRNHRANQQESHDRHHEGHDRGYRGHEGRDRHHEGHDRFDVHEDYHDSSDESDDEYNDDSHEGCKHSHETRQRSQNNNHHHHREDDGEYEYEDEKSKKYDDVMVREDNYDDHKQHKTQTRQNPKHSPRLTQQKDEHNGDILSDEDAELHHRVTSQGQQIHGGYEQNQRHLDGYHSNATDSTDPNYIPGSSQGNVHHYDYNNVANSGCEIHHHHYHGDVHNYFQASEEETREYERGQENVETKHEQKDEKGVKDERIWRFQIGDNFGPYEYIDHEGYIQGFHVDLIKAICHQAGKKCHHILDAYNNCWNTAAGFEYPGIGLMAQWYDGCVGLMASPDRLNSFNFSLPFAANYRAALYYKEDRHFENPRNITGLNVGIIDGWAVGRRCLERQLTLEGNLHGQYTVTLFDSHEDMVLSLKREEVDAILSVNVGEPRKLGMVMYGPLFQCTVSGTALMARYGDEVIEWWNEAFLQLRENGGYRRLCDSAQKTHGFRGKVQCID